MATTTITLTQRLLGMYPYIIVEVRDGEATLDAHGLTKRQAVALTRRSLRNLKRAPATAFLSTSDADEEEDTDIFDDDSPRD